MKDCNVIKRPSPHGSNRDQEPDIIIIHAMGQYIRVKKGFYSGKRFVPAGVHHAADFLELAGMSAHGLVEPNGDIIKCRFTSKGAYHAKNHNTNTIGIEFLVEGIYDYEEFKAKIQGGEWMTDKQYECGGQFIAFLCNFWKISDSSKIKGHDQIDPERKIDPAVFDWQRLYFTIKGDAINDYKFKFNVNY